jgi:hypothetical protein
LEGFTGDEGFAPEERAADKLGGSGEEAAHGKDESDINGRNVRGRAHSDKHDEALTGPRAGGLAGWDRWPGLPDLAPLIASSSGRTAQARACSKSHFLALSPMCSDIPGVLSFNMLHSHVLGLLFQCAD